MKYNKKKIEGNPAIPSVGKLAKNFGKAVVRHAIDGFKDVDMEVYQRRLNICNRCPGNYRQGNRCTHENCGCFLSEKAWWRSEKCPEGYWEKDGEVDKK